DSSAGCSTWTRCKRASCEAVVQGKHVVFCRLNKELLLQSAQLVGHFGGEVVLLRIIRGEVVKLPRVAVDHVWKLAQAQIPGWLGRRGTCDPAIVVNRAVTDHFEILRGTGGWGVSLGLVESIGHAHAFDGLLGDTVDHHGCLNARRLEYRRHNVNHVVELSADASHVADVTGP